MKTVVIATELSLAPEGGSKLVKSSLANDDSKHVVLNARTDDDVLVVFRSAILHLQVGKEFREEIGTGEAARVPEHSLDDCLQENGEGVVLVEVGHRGGGRDGGQVVPVKLGMLLVGLFDGRVGEGVMGLRDVGIVHDGDIASVALRRPRVVEGQRLVEARAEEMLEGLTDVVIEHPAELDAVAGALAGARVEAGANEAGDDGSQAGGLDASGAQRLEDLPLNIQVGMDGCHEDEGHDGVVRIDVLGGGAVALDGGVELDAEREEEGQDGGAHELHGDGGNGHPEQREHAGHEGGLGEEPGAGLEVVGGGWEGVVNLYGVGSEVGDVGEVFDDGAIMMAAELAIGVDTIALGVDGGHDGVPVRGDGMGEGLACGLDELGLPIGASGSRRCCCGCSPLG